MPTQNDYVIQRLRDGSYLGANGGYTDEVTGALVITASSAETPAREDGSHVVLASPHGETPNWRRLAGTFDSLDELTLKGYEGE